MIQANELRIGNWIMRANGFAQRIQDYDYEHTDFDAVSPIPLTAEILEAAGLPDQLANEKGAGWFHRGEFVVNKGRYYYHFNKNRKSLTLAIAVTIDKRTDTTAFAWDIKYLHQLQNLYFALTGQELEINLTKEL